MPGEIVTVVRSTVGDTIRAVGAVAVDGTDATRDVLKEAIGAVEDVSVTALHAVNGVVHEAAGVGGNMANLAVGAASGTVNAVGSLGGAAVHTVSDVLVEAAGGIKNVIAAILPSPRRGPGEPGRERARAETEAAAS